MLPVWVMSLAALICSALVPECAIPLTIAPGLPPLYQIDQPLGPAQPPVAQGNTPGVYESKLSLKGKASCPSAAGAIRPPAASDTAKHTLRIKPSFVPTDGRGMRPEGKPRLCAADGCAREGPVP